MLVVTTENISGFRVTKTIGQVFGVVVRSRGIGGDFVAGLRSIVGGEINEFTEMLEDARRHAIDRMVVNAAMVNANAIIMMRFDGSELHLLVVVLSILQYREPDLFFIAGAGSLPRFFAGFGEDWE